MSKLAQWKTNPDSDLAERLRQFQTVCVFSINNRKSGRSKQNSGGDIYKVGAEMFGLRNTEIVYCQGRAQNYLDEVRDLTRIRARRGLPIDSDAMMIALKKEAV